MAITSDKYDQFKIDKIKLYLQNQSDKGQARYYEVYVDNLKAVHRTNDLNEFDSYEDYMTEDTEKIRIVMYSTHPTSPRNEQYVFVRKKSEEDKPSTQTTLSGVEIENRINEKIGSERERWEHEQLKKELEETKTKLKEAEEYVDVLENKVAHFESKKLHWGNVNLGEFASIVLEGIVRRNPQLLAKLPGGEALAGVIEQDNQDKLNTAASPETEVNFKKKENGVEDAVVLTQEEKGYLEFMRSMAESFDDKQLLILTQIILKLEQEPNLLPTVAQLLNIDLNKI